MVENDNTVGRIFLNSPEMRENFNIVRSVLNTFSDAIRESLKDFRKLMARVWEMFEDIRNSYRRLINLVLRSNRQAQAETPDPYALYDYTPDVDFNLEIEANTEARVRKRSKLKINKILKFIVFVHTVIVSYEAYMKGISAVQRNFMKVKDFFIELL